MRFFSRLVFICNCCFIIAVILRLVELRHYVKGQGTNLALKFQPLESTFVVIGYGAVFINFIFLLVLIPALLLRSMMLVPRWIILANIIFFFVQVCYFTFLKF